MARKKRADGRVQVQIDLGITPDGRRQRKSFYGRTLTEARMERDAWIEDQKQRKVFAEPEITLKKWSNTCLDSVKNTTELTTYKAKESAVRGQNSFVFSGEIAFGDMPVRDIRPIHVQAYMESLHGMSKGTIAQRRSVLKFILSAAVANGIIPTSPWQNIKAPKGSYSGHRLLPEQYQALIESTATEHRCGVWALVMMYTGMRREELAALDVGDIDFKNGQIHIHQAAVLKEGGRIKSTKTAAGDRIVPIFPQIENALKAAVRERTSGRLFLSAQGHALTETSFKQAWKSYMIMLERALNDIKPCGHTAGYRRASVKKDFEKRKIKYKELDSFTPHDLRYTYATMLYDAGVDVKTAAYLLGHADIVVTMKIYTQLSLRRKLSGIGDLQKYMAGKSGNSSDHQLTTTSTKIKGLRRIQRCQGDPKNPR